MFQSRTKTEQELDALSLLYLLFIFINSVIAMYVSIVYVDIYMLLFSRLWRLWYTLLCSIDDKLPTYMSGALYELEVFCVQSSLLWKCIPLATT